MPTFPGTEMAMIADVMSVPLSILYAMERSVCWSLPPATTLSGSCNPLMRAVPSMLFVEDGLLKPVNQMKELTIHVLFCERDYVRLVSYRTGTVTDAIVLVGAARID